VRPKERRTLLRPASFPSSVTGQHDAVSTNVVASWSQRSRRDVGREIGDDVKPDVAYLYSTDSDHKPEDEDCTAGESLVGSEKVCVSFLYVVSIFVT